MSATIIKIKFCDCGNPAVKKDGSGWTCQRCIDANHAVSHMLERIIEQQRREDNFEQRTDRQRAQVKAWHEKNYQKRLEYFRNYSRKKYANHQSN